jgi:hypothetical protein
LLIMKGFSVNAYVFFQALSEVPQKIALCRHYMNTFANFQLAEILFGHKSDQCPFVFRWRRESPRLSCLQVSGSRVCLVFFLYSGSWIFQSARFVFFLFDFSGRCRFISFLFIFPFTIPLPVRGGGTAWRRGGPSFCPMAEDLPPVEVTGGRRGGGFGVDSVHFHEFSCSESEGVGEELERWTLPWRSCLWRDHRIEEAVGASASGRPGTYHFDSSPAFYLVC